MHCSTIAYFMQPRKEKTPNQLWQEAAGELDMRQAKYDALEDRLKKMKKGTNMLVGIEKCRAKVAELEPHRNDEPLSKTAKSYLKKYYAYLKYGKWSASLDKGNKYTKKGELGEPDSIRLCGFLDDRPYTKNPERFEDEFLTGEPDIIHLTVEGPYIIDVKTSWDIETFMDCLGKDLSPLYWWQIQGYFALTGAQSGEVSYCLVDTPEVLLNQEKNWLMNRMDAATELNPEYMAAEKELINNMTFSDMPPQERRIRFTVERDDEAIEKIYKRVVKCREYLAEIEQMHLTGTFAGRSTTEEFAEVEEMN